MIMTVGIIICDYSINGGILRISLWWMKFM